MLLRIKVSSQVKNFFDGQALSVFVPSQKGILQIFPRHIPLIAKLKEGIVRIQRDGSEIEVPILGGFLNVEKDQVSVLVF